MRPSTEAAVLKQQIIATDLENRLTAANADMAVRFATIRQELVEEFASTSASMIAIHD